MSSSPHTRQNLLTGDWVLVSPHRITRPWQGEQMSVPPLSEIAHDSACYLCPGNRRANGQVNPAYKEVFVFDNDFPALLAEADARGDDPLLVARAETGVCRVICYAGEHHLTLARLAPDRIRRVVDAWVQQYEALARRPDIAAVTIFENRGKMMGASNPHPHGQVWATASVPNELAREDARQRAHFDAHHSPLLMDYLAREMAADERIVFANAHFVTLVPFWAAWPFETLLLPRHPVATLGELEDVERDALAGALSDIARRYDALFHAPFPYTMGWHQRPTKSAHAPSN